MNQMKMNYQQYDHHYLFVVKMQEIDHSNLLLLVNEEYPNY